MSMEDFYINTLEEGVNVSNEQIKWLCDEWHEWDSILRNKELRTKEFLSYYYKLTSLVISYELRNNQR